MKKYVKYIDDESVKALEKTLGMSVQSVLAPSARLYIGGSFVITQSVSMRIGVREFLILQNDWTDTPNEYLHYYFLGATISDRPKDILVKEQKSNACWSYFMDHFSLQLGARSRVVSIQVLESGCIGENESVAYDAGVLFCLENGRKFSITREESISGFLQISHAQKDIKDAISGLNIRLQYEL